MSSKNNPTEQDDATKSNILSWLMDNINPLNWNWGSILMGLLVVTGVYFAMRSEKVQEWIGHFLDDDGHPGSGKEKVKGFVHKIDAFLENLLPDSICKKLGISGAAASMANSLTDDEFRKQLPGELPDPAKDVIVKYRKQFVDTVSNANGGKLSKETALNDKSLYAFLTSDDANVQSFVNALLPTLKNTGQGNSKTQETVTKSIKQIVADDRLNVLLSDKYRRRTIALMLEMSGNTGLTVDVLDQQLNGMLQNGKATPALRALLNGFLGEKGTGTSTATTDQGTSQSQGVGTGEATAPSTTNTPQNGTAQSTSTPPVQNTDAQVLEAKINIALQSPALMVGAENVNAFNTMRQSMGDEKLKRLMMSASADYSDETAQMAAMQKATMGDLPTLKALKTFADAAQIDKLRPELQGPIALLKTYTGDVSYLWAMTTRNVSLEEIAKVKTVFVPESGPVNVHYIMQQLLNKENRDLLKKADTRNVSGLLVTSIPNTTAEEKAFRAQATLMLSPQNLNTFIAATETIGTHAKELDQRAGNNAASVSAMTVLNATVSLMMGDNTAFTALPPETVAAFFKDPTYSSAITKLVDAKNGITLPGSMGTILNSFKQHWGTVLQDQNRKDGTERDGWGIAEVLGDTDAVRELQTRMKDGGESSKHGQWGINAYRFWNDINPFSKGMPKKFDENLEHLVALSNTMIDIKAGSNVSPSVAANSSQQNTRQ